MQKKLLAVALAGMFSPMFAVPEGQAAVETPPPANPAGSPAATNGAAAVPGTQPKVPEKVIPPSPIKGTVFTPVKYSFKKDDLGEKRATVEMLIPAVTMEGLVERMQDSTRATTTTKNKDGTEVITEDKLTNGEKVQNLVLELLRDLATQHGRLQVADEKTPISKQEELDLTKLDITYIANIPPAERRGGGISKETWEAFYKNYTEIMPEVTAKKKDQVENAAKLLVARLQPVKTQKKILDFLKGQLGLWFTSTPVEAQEEFAEVYEFLTGKIEEFMQRDEAELLANL